MQSDVEITDRLRSDRLAGRTCVVTGSSRGIGRAIAEELAAEGADVVVNYRTSKEAATDVAAWIEEQGDTAKAVQADISEMDDVERMAREVHDEFGRIDVLVNNAGITIDRKFGDLTREDWDRVLDVNLGGAFNCTEVFYEDLKRSDHGRLINISSVIGEMGNIGQANYAASKSGLIGLTKTLAKELAPHGTTANAVAPGFTETAMLDDVPDPIRQSILDDIPLGRFASTEDVAMAVSYLASSRGSYITGQVLDVNGGIHL
jgi:3-oxoacyl-[acyl-carrier protein] reductase